jgi:hypothetical protein
MYSRFSIEEPEPEWFEPDDEEPEPPALCRRCRQHPAETRAGLCWWCDDRDAELKMDAADEECPF